jgi:aspartyl-tRNA(Asn)/glutamyl-tRNA(Gln) amidotransferase subunit A
MMAVTDDPAALDLVAAGRQLRSGALTSAALTEACLEHIARRNDELRAFITVTADSARAAAADADRELAAGRDRGPLHGIPISLKDIIDQQGVPTTAASRVRGYQPAPSDALVTSRLKAAGAVLVGKTNLHEFAFGTTSAVSAFGAVRHPIDVSRSAGGSSGGSAVSVVTGMAIATIGTDTGGSIRVPAAACGIVGLKPGFGEVPRDGVVPLSTTFDHVGPLARSVADAAAVYGVLARRAVRPPAIRPLRGLRLCRLGGYMEALLEPGVRRVYDATVERLRSGGALITTAELAHAEDIASIYLVISLAEGAAYHARTLEQCPELYDPSVRLRVEQGRYILAEDYLRALAGCEVIREEVSAALADTDALILPGSAITAPRLDQDTTTLEGAELPVRGLMLRLSQPFNLSGHPALVMPCGETTEHLPVSLQLVGQRSNTRALLDVAATVEAAIR